MIFYDDVEFAVEVAASAGGGELSLAGVVVAWSSLAGASTMTVRDGSPLLTVAGLWDAWNNKETGERIKSCTMIITRPNDFVAEVHDRIPVLLMPEQFEHWLSGAWASRI